MSKRREVVIVQALVTEFAVEALDVGVLCPLAGGNGLQIHALAIGPAIECTARELRALIGANRSTALLIEASRSAGK